MRGGPRTDLGRISTLRLGKVGSEETRDAGENLEDKAVSSRARHPQRRLHIAEPGTAEKF